MDFSSLNLPHHSVLLKWALTFVGVVIVGAVFIGGYGGLNTLMDLFGTTSNTGNNLKGTLFLSVGTISTTTGLSTGVFPILASPADGLLTYLPIDTLGGNPAMILQQSMSGNTNFMSFLGAVYQAVSSTTSSINDGLTVYRADLSAVSSYQEMLSTLKSALPVSVPNANDYFREFPVVSSTGAVLYSSLGATLFAASAANSLATLSADDWNIMMVDPLGKVTTITQGLRPKWIDQTHFAYLKSDGIYLYDLANKTELKVWASDSVNSIVNGFDVSDDGTLVAFSDPGGSTLTILRVLNWAGNIVSVIDTVSTQTGNLTFSPDNAYLAVIVPETNDAVSSGFEPMIRYYSLDTKEFVSDSIPVDTTLINAIYLNDWQ